MKRQVIVLAILVVGILLAGWSGPWIIAHYRIVVLGAMTFLIGFVLSYLVSLIAIKLVGVKRSQLFRHTRNAVYIMRVVVGSMLSFIVLQVFTKPVGKLLYGADITWRDYESLTGIIVLILLATAVVGFFYVLAWLYEESVGKRMRRFSRPSFRRGGWRLPLKLTIAGIAVFLFAEYVSNTGLVQAIEFIFEQQRGVLSWQPGINDSLGSVLIANRGISHQEFLRAVYLISTELRRGHARAVLVPLPKDLALRQGTFELIQKIHRLGFVVFAVPPNEESEYPSLWVDDPIQGKLDLNWGVISAVKLEQFPQYNRKFYPLTYRRTSDGSTVPDAGVRLIQNIQGKNAEEPFIVDHDKFKLGRFETGLYGDQSIPIWYSSWGEIQAIFIEERSDSLRGLNTSAFENRIVIIDPGEGITGVRNFHGTYTQILNELLIGKKRILLEKWTPALVTVVVLIAVVLFTVYKPWQASLGMVILAFGQGFLCWQMNSRFGIIVEAAPMFIAAMSSFMLFLFVRVNHERITLQKEEKQRALDELLAARDMQMGLMPKEDPIVPGFDISGICVPANDVGGDFFDYVWLDGKRRKLGIAVADVSGKAMKAAITAVMTSGMIYREAGGNESPKTILRNMNRPLYTKLDSRMFTALSFAVIDTRKKELRFSNAGQSYPLLKRGKEVRLLEVKGARLPLGVKEDVTYGEMAVKLKKGDTLIFYTDGIPEAKDEKDEFYGFERFKSLMENLGDLLAKEMRDRILSEVKLFTGNAPQHDDMTVVVVRVN